MKTDKELYKYHCANFTRVEISLDRVFLVLRDYISKNDNSRVESFLCLAIFLLGVWIETRLCKLLYENGGFTPDQRARILAKQSQLEYWESAVEEAIRRKYGVPNAQLTIRNLPHSVYSRYMSLIDLIRTDLRPIIELRNKMAHGQWVYTLNNSCDDIASDQMRDLNRENILSLQFKRSLVSSLSGIINDLVTSKVTFERDFDKHFSAITSTKLNLQNRNYHDYKNMMRNKYVRGRTKIATNLSS